MSETIDESSADQRSIRIAVVHERPDEGRRLTRDLAAFSRRNTVTYFQTASEARSRLEQAFQTDGHGCWFVVCGLQCRSWSTLVFLEWLRSRTQQTCINTALLTDTVRELLPLAVADRVDLRLLPTSVETKEIQAWIEEMHGDQRAALPTVTA